MIHLPVTYLSAQPSSPLLMMLSLSASSSHSFLPFLPSISRFPSSNPHSPLSTFPQVMQDDSTDNLLQALGCHNRRRALSQVGGLRLIGVLHGVYGIDWTSCTVYTLSPMLFTFYLLCYLHFISYAIYTLSLMLFTLYLLCDIHCITYAIYTVSYMQLTLYFLYNKHYLFCDKLCILYAINTVSGIR